MSDTIEHLRKQLAEAEENLRLIQERKAQFVLETDIPLQLIKEERRLRAEIPKLRAKLDEENKARRERRGRQRVVNLRPLDMTHTFKDRAREMQELCEHLADSSVRLVSVVGRAGMGKTALVSRVLGDLEQDALPIPGGDRELPINGILYLSARSTGLSLERIYADVGRMLGESDAGRLATRWTSDAPLPAKVEYLLETMGDGLYIILLDNLEDLLAEDGTIAEEGLRVFVDCCLTQPGGAQLVATSRDQVTVAAAALRGARSIPLQQGLPQDEAIALLRDLDPQGELGLSNAPKDELRRVVQLTKGIPRALEILAGILHEDPTASLTGLLDDEKLVGEQVVEQLVAEGYRRLGEAKRRVIEALAVFDRPVQETAIAYLLHPWWPGLDVQDRLPSLVRGYFVSANRRAERYSLHPLDRDYAYRQIPDDRESGSYNRRNLELRAADFYASIRKPESEWHTIDDLEPQLNEFEHRVLAEDYDDAAHLILEATHRHLVRWGYARRIVSLGQQLEGKIKDKVLENRILGNQGHAYAHLGHYENAVSYYEQALGIAREIGIKASEGHHLGYLGRAYRNLEKYAPSVECHQQALSIAREMNDEDGECINLCNLGITLRNKGQHDQSIDYLKEALKISRRTGNKHIEGRALMNLGKAHLETGLTEKAITYHKQALHILRDIGYRREEGDTLCSIGWAYESLGKSQQAKERYEQSLAIMREIGDRRGEANSLLSLGGYLLRLGDLQPATEHLLNAREIAEEVGKHSAGHFANRYLVQAYLESGRLEDAWDSIVLTLTHNLPLYNSEAAVLHGIVLARMGQLEAAQAAFEKARHFATEELQGTSRYVRASYTHGLAIVGLALLSTGQAQNELIVKAGDAYEAARAVCDDKGVLADALRQLDELRPLDSSGMLDAIADKLIEQPAHPE